MLTWALSSDLTRRFVVGDNYPDLRVGAEGQSFLEAIKAVADYEQGLVALYPAQTFELGLLQNDAHHLSLHSSFEGWTPQSPKELNLPDWLAMSGVDFLLLLKGRHNEDKLLLTSFDIGKLERRLGLKSEKSADLFTDQQLMFGAQLATAHFGAVSGQEFKGLSGRRALIVQIKRPLGEAPGTVVLLGSRGRLYVFVLLSSGETREGNQEKLYETIKTMDFNHKPSDTKAIADLRSGIGNENSIPDMLQHVCKLAGIGEYGAAADVLSRIRVLIAEQMPKPVIEGNVARFPLYGITLQNPDPEKWKLSGIETLSKACEKIDQWMAKNEDKRGASGQVIKSNITDND